MIRTLISRLLLAAMMLLTSVAVVAGDQAADRIFINAKAYTLDAGAPWAEAVAVTADTITYVGDNAGALALANESTITHDLKGQMLLPGFIDTHMHPITGGAFARALSLDTFGTIDGWVQAIEEYAHANPEAELIFGYGFLATTFGPAGPSRQLIDAVVADRPVLIMDEGLHGAWANSKALELLKIDRSTADPVPGFSYYKRDSKGEPTGYLLEGTGMSAMAGLNAVTQEVIFNGTSDVIHALNAYGVTSVFDAGAIGYEEVLPAVLARLEMDGDLTIRIVGAYRPNGPEQVAQAVPAADHWRKTIVGENYHYRMLKLMLDGTVEGRTAAMFEDYQGEPGNSGEIVFSQAQTTRMVEEAAAIDIDVHIHGLGERAVHEALNAIEAARLKYSESSTRYTICHIQVITDEDLPRFAALDVIAQSTPLWASYDSYGKVFVSEDQFSRFWRFNSLKKSGARLTWGSDFPASGAGMLGMSPILQMEIGHTRQNPGEPNAPIQPREGERLDIDTLIRGYTIDAAYQLHMEAEIGSLEVGKKADIVVLDKNLFEIDSYEIHTVKPQLTLMNGKVVYSALP